MSFDVAAGDYDGYMGVWSRQLVPALLDLGGVRPGQRILDVGAGTGALTEMAVARLGVESVTAVDPSPSFVAALRRRVPGIEVRQAAAEQLPFPDGSFDGSYANLVVHFMTDPVAGLEEMARVTRPDGVVAVTVWDYAGGRGPLGPFWEAARHQDPGVVDESRLAGTARGQLAELLVAAGLDDVEETALPAGRTFSGFDDWWEPFTRGVGPGGGYVAQLGSEAARELRDRCRARLPEGPFRLTAHAWAARGTVSRISGPDPFAH